MKKIVTLLLMFTLILGLVSGCSTTKETSSDVTQAPTSAPTTGAGEEVTTPAATSTAKTGLAVITSLSKSAAATADTEGLAQVDSLIAAVLVGSDGKILDCKIDAAQTKIKFSADGKVTTDLASVVKSKQELGSEYGMKKNSKIGKEWNEQADAFAAYVIGKTTDEVSGIALNEKGNASDADLSASVSINIADYIKVVATAVANAKELGASSEDQLGLGVTTTIDKSKDVAADAEGLAQAYTNITVTTVDKDGKITSCYIDAVQGNVNFDSKGVITTDLTKAVQTKQELGMAYDMKKASKIGKEWFEQADAFASYVSGKTVEEVKGITLNEQGTAADADLAASVSVHIGPFIANIDKAVANAVK